MTASRQSASTADAAHEAAIVSAGQDIERHMALHREALHRCIKTGCFSDLCDADAHRLAAQEAAELQRVLILNRSPEQVARMEAARAMRMATEPGA